MNRIKSLNYVLQLVLIAGVLVLLNACTTDPEKGLAPYEGDRPLELLEVTTSFTPQVQWLGGRVAAVGANEGPRAELDSSLVWLMTADGNTISSYVDFGQDSDTVSIANYGGTPLDSLVDGVEYTFWIAEMAAYDSGLDTLFLNDTIFNSKSLIADLVIKGRSGGEKNGSGDYIHTLNVFREQTLTEDKIILNWTPADSAFRRIAIRQGRFGDFTDLVWHIVLPDSVPAQFYPPIVIGSLPNGADEATAWPSSGFETETSYFIWMVNDRWNESFAPTSEGYAWFKVTPL